METTSVNPFILEVIYSLLKAQSLRIVRRNMYKREALLIIKEDSFMDNANV